MKKIFTILILTATINLVAQEIKQPMQIAMTKNSFKLTLLSSGACFIAGSIINFRGVNQSPPKPEEYLNPNNPNGAKQYERALKDYQYKQNTSRKATSIMYGLGGILLTVGAVIVF